MKKIILLSLAVLSIGCDDSKNSQGSTKPIFSSCQIISSSAPLASERLDDLQQCWPMTQGWGDNDKKLAIDWCEAKAGEYMERRYSVGHSYKLQVASTNCPK